MGSGNQALSDGIPKSRSEDVVGGAIIILDAKADSRITLVAAIVVYRILFCYISSAGEPSP
jgi:hypothetical protein